MTMTVSVHIQHRDAQSTTFQRRHDLRTGHLPKNINMSRTHLNSTLILPLQSAALKAICTERRSRRATVRRMRSDAAIATRGILSFGVDAQPIISALPVADQDALFFAAARAVCAVIGGEPTGLVVHRDESAIHAHWQMPAYGADGVPHSKGTTRAHTAAMQDAAGRVYAHLGVHRGTPKAVREADGDPWHVTHHRSVRQLHADLPGEIRIALAACEAVTAERNRLVADYEQLVRERDRVIGLLDARRSTADRETDAATAHLAHARETIRQAEREMQRTHEALARVQALLADKGRELDTLRALGVFDPAPTPAPAPAPAPTRTRTRGPTLVF